MHVSLSLSYRMRERNGAIVTKTKERECDLQAHKNNYDLKRKTLISIYFRNKVQDVEK